MTNNPPKEAIEYKPIITDLQKQFEALAGIDNEVDAAIYNDFIRGVQLITKDAEKSRKALKEPHFMAGKMVDSNFRGVSDSLIELMASAKAVLQEFLVKEKRKADEKMWQAQKEAADKARQAAALADDQIVGAEALADAKEAETAAQIMAGQAENAGRAGSVTGGNRTSSLKTVRFAKIANAELASSHYSSHPEIVSTILKVANAQIRAAKGGFVNIPGIRIKEEQRL